MLVAIFMPLRRDTAICWLSYIMPTAYTSRLCHHHYYIYVVIVVYCCLLIIFHTLAIVVTTARSPLMAVAEAYQRHVIIIKVCFTKNTAYHYHYFRHYYHACLCFISYVCLLPYHQPPIIRVTIILLWHISCTLFGFPGHIILLIISHYLRYHHYIL